MRTSFLTTLMIAVSLAMDPMATLYASNPAFDGEKITKKSNKKTFLKGKSEIDRLIAAAHKKQGTIKNPPLGDEAFVRRIYLDIVGRIPSYKETRDFLDSKEALKRQNIIDELLDSEGYVSHNYHFWADLLRLKTRLNNQAPGGPVYIEWVKQNLRENKPYDKVVYELLTAEGYLWDNPAVGYYLRDPGMPLDNMANTVQVFLGTRMQCAQCHDHPFDKWSQKDFYHMAAYTFGVNTRMPYFQNPKIRKARMIAQRKGLFKDIPRQTIQRSMRTLLEPILYGAHETGRDVRLPKDYQYKDAKPNQLIEAKPMFGENLEMKPDDDPREVYARWMTSPKNPRFALVIANRMWKKVMGAGLIEPVDDLSDDTRASMPELMAYLEQLTVDLDFDLKALQRILYNTDVYQRETCRTEFDPGKPFYFPGPVMNRMTAEQLWDSYLSLMIEDLDQRRIPDAQTMGQTMRLKSFEKRAEKLERMDAEDIVDALAQVTSIERKFADRQVAMRNKLADATSEAERGRARREFGKLRREMYQEIGGMMGMEDGGGMMQGEALREAYRRRRTTGQKAFDPRWKGFPKEMVRASEVSSPAPPGHFLRQFGQSDREVIENANDDASIPQALALLNGKGFWLMKSQNSQIMKTYKSMKNDTDRLDALFLSTLSRYPRDEERAFFAAQTKDMSRLKGFEHSLWVLTNAQEFRFVQ